MTWLSEHPEQATEMGQASRQRFADHLTASRMGVAYDGLYRSIMAAV
jgi:hypothetical protein